ncbi:MAG: hypothetical protein H0X39_14575 [Actinobacteria bacterium]|nr:hypothetical protein [Actinomycetota bacterium]
MPIAVTLHYLLHWPTHGGYNFVSGPLADITLVTAFTATLCLWWRRHNCHVHRCWRLQWHPHPDHGHPVCKKHHPDGHRVTATGELHAPPRGHARPKPDGV